MGLFILGGMLSEVILEGVVSAGWFTIGGTIIDIVALG